jgi:hypothetical protein
MMGYWFSGAAAGNQELERAAYKCMLSDTIRYKKMDE